MMAFEFFAAGRASIAGMLPIEVKDEATGSVYRCEIPESAQFVTIVHATKPPFLPTFVRWTSTTGEKFDVPLVVQNRPFKWIEALRATPAERNQWETDAKKLLGECRSFIHAYLHNTVGTENGWDIHDRCVDLMNGPFPATALSEDSAPVDHDDQCEACSDLCGCESRRALKSERAGAHQLLKTLCIDLGADWDSDGLEHVHLADLVRRLLEGIEDRKSKDNT